MKNLLLVFSILVVLLISCKTTPPPPSKEDIARKNIEAVLVKSLDDPSSYEFDTIYCAHVYTLSEQLDLVHNNIENNISRYKCAILEKDFKYLNEKSYRSDIVICERLNITLDSLRKAIPNSKLNDTIAYCYSYHFRANNAFGAKVKGHLYLLTDRENKITEYVQVDDESAKIPSYMVYPIIESYDYPICEIIRQNPYETETSSDNCNWEFKELLNINNFNH